MRDLKAWRRNNPEKVKGYSDRQRITRYGITEEQYARMLEEQGNVCTACGDPFGDEQPHIDHDHKCCPSQRSSCGKCVRGLIHRKCNLALGYADDDPQKLLKLQQYLTKREMA